MAVPQRRTTRSKRAMRRAHDNVGLQTGSVDSLALQNGSTHALHLNHHITKDGYYGGKQVVAVRTRTTASEAETEENQKAEN